MKKQYVNVLIKFFWTAAIISIYFLGTKLILPYVDINKVFSFGGATDTLVFANAVTGGNLRSLSLFTLGLSPWMSSMLIWQMLVSAKLLGADKLSQTMQERMRMFLTFVIGLIQAIVIVVNAPLMEGYQTVEVYITSISVLISGTFLMVWLSDLNASYGVGGSMMLIIPGMIAYLPYDVIDTFNRVYLESYWYVGIGVASFIMLIVTIIVGKAKYRIPINKVTIHNRFKKYSYFDISLNPAGGMPAMYAMTLVTIPQYLLLFLSMFFPNAKWISEIMSILTIGQWGWFIIYVATILLLGYAFSFITVNPEQVSDAMMKQGEYIYGIYPGKDTVKFLTKLTWHFSFIGNLYLLMMTFLPTLLILKDIQLLRLAMIPGVFLIFNGMVITIEDEVKAQLINTKYVF